MATSERENAKQLYNNMLEKCREFNWSIPDYVTNDIKEYNPDDGSFGFYENAVHCLVGWICLGSEGDGTGGYEDGLLFLDEAGASEEDKEYYMEWCDWYF